MTDIETLKRIGTIAAEISSTTGQRYEDVMSSLIAASNSMLIVSNPSWFDRLIIVGFVLGVLTGIGFGFLLWVVL